MRYAAILMLVLAAGLPAVALAEAGFAKNSLFLSKSSVTEGDTVLIHAIVSNDAATKFTGTLQITDAGANVGSVPVSLTAGEADTESVSWKPTAGAHTITAALTASDGTVVEQESAVFTVDPKPVVSAPAGQTVAAVDSSAPLQQDIANVSPQVASATAPAFNIIDGFRASAAGVLDAQLANAKNNLTKTPAPGLVLGSSTGALSDPTQSFWYILWTAYLYILTIARWLVGNAAVFYPVLAIVFFYLLWRLYARMRRPY